MNTSLSQIEEIIRFSWKTTLVLFSDPLFYSETLTYLKLLSRLFKKKKEKEKKESQYYRISQ